VQAESARASADERDAKARRSEAEELAAKALKERAIADRQSIEAERQSDAARSHHAEARRVDPDASDSGHEEALALDRGWPARLLRGECRARPSAGRHEPPPPRSI
jgi:hypothetical protein